MTWPPPFSLRKNRVQLLEGAPITKDDKRSQDEYNYSMQKQRQEKLPYLVPEVPLRVFRCNLECLEGFPWHTFELLGTCSFYNLKGIEAIIQH